MRKIGVVMFILLVIGLTGCKEQGANPLSSAPVVRPASLVEEDLALLDGIGLDEAFVFDFDVNDTHANRVDSWVEYYEYGEKKDDVAGIGTELLPDDSNMKLIFSRSTIKLSDKQEYEQFVVSHLTDSGVGSGENVVKNKGEVNSQNSDRIAKKTILEPGEAQTLAVIIETNTKGVSTFDFTGDPKSFLDEIKQYDRVYLLRVKLSDGGGKNEGS